MHKSSRNLRSSTSRLGMWSATILVALGGSLIGSSGPATAAPPTTQIYQDAYLADFASSTTRWFDASTQTWSPLVLPNTTNSVVPTPDGSAVYFASADAGALFVVSTADQSLVRTIPLGADYAYIAGPPLAFSPDGTRLYVAGVNGVVTLIDTATGAIITSLDVGGQLGGVAVTPDGQTLYVAGWNDNEIVVLNAADLSLITRFPTSIDPQSIQISPDGTTLYVAHSSATLQTSDVLTVIDTATNAVTANITRAQFGSTNQGPSSLSLSADGTKLFVTDPASNFSTINTSDLTFTKLATGSSFVFASLGMTAGAETAILALQGRVAYADIAAQTITTADTTPTLAMAVAVLPDQAPTARFSTVPGNVGQQTSFDASASSATGCPVGTYSWDFGDGTTASSSTPTIDHIYTTTGNYDVALTVTTTCGTSTTTAFTGQTNVRRGNPSATATSNVIIAGDSTLTIDPIQNRSTVESVSDTVTAVAHTDGAEPITYSANGLPTGISIDPATGTMSGTPTVPGTFNVTVTATAGTLSAETSFVWAVTQAHVIPPTGNPGADTKLNTNSGSGALATTGSNQSLALGIAALLATLGTTLVATHLRRKHS